jgi:hypothetical protein
VDLRADLDDLEKRKFLAITGLELRLQIFIGAKHI